MQVALYKEQNKKKRNIQIKRILVKEFGILLDRITNVLISLELTELAEGREAFTDPVINKIASEFETILSNSFYRLQSHLVLDIKNHKKNKL